MRELNLPIYADYGCKKTLGQIEFSLGSRAAQFYSTTTRNSLGGFSHNATVECGRNITELLGSPKVILNLIQIGSCNVGVYLGVVCRRNITEILSAPKVILNLQKSSYNGG
ncbi:hypothetical protein CEXT_53541 [Caerostris extrusa]|uniref:Uncharacterized protein n=1 Tax=Caerostris extrusa TaxID=172846 RepID=A0AAV4TUZ5_CAEEX|nr:hypothetical protein CEXT_53541 [Caerostris extrusa]